MTLGQVIERTGMIIGVEGDSSQYPAQIANKLRDCVQTVYTELITEHVPLRTKEKATLSGNRLYFEDLSYGVREILRISSDAGRLKFNVFSEYVEVEDGYSGEVEVEYLYYVCPETNADPLILPPQFTEYIMAVGAAAEYFYRSSLIDEALFFRNRFESGVNNLSRSGRVYSLPRRRLL